MGSVEVVEVLPFLELVVEHVGVVDDDAVVEHSVELLVVDPVRSLHLPSSRGVCGLDVDVADLAVEDVPVELRLESEPLLVWICLDLNGSFSRTWSRNWIAVTWLFFG